MHDVSKLRATKPRIEEADVHVRLHLAYRFALRCRYCTVFCKPKVGSSMLSTGTTFRSNI